MSISEKTHKAWNTSIRLYETGLTPLTHEGGHVEFCSISFAKVTRKFTSQHRNDRDGQHCIFRCSGCGSASCHSRSGTCCSYLRWSVGASDVSDCCSGLVTLCSRLCSDE